MAPFTGHIATDPEGSLHSELLYLLWPTRKDLKVDRTSHNFSQGLAGHRYGASQHLSRVLQATRNHAVNRRTLRGNDDRWIGHALASCRGFYIPALQCMACMIRRRRCNSSRTICRSCTCGANKSFSINLDVVGNAGDNCSALSYLKCLIEHLVHFIKGPGLGPLKYGQKWCTEI